MSGQILVELTPSTTLTFKNPEDKATQETLTLHNPHDEHVLFKIKTTAPKRYCVRPNQGRIEPGGTASVEILLNQLKPDEIVAGTKDKFLVQTMFGSGDAVADDVWKTAPKDKIGEAKLRCQFDTDGGEASGTPTRSKPVHGPYQGKLSMAAKPSPTVAEKPVATADEESELARAIKINTQLKESNKKLEVELASGGDGLRQRRPSKSGAKDFADPERIRQMSQKGDMLVPSLIVAVLLGWFIGHFIL